MVTLTLMEQMFSSVCNVRAPGYVYYKTPITKPNPNPKNKTKTKTPIT